MKPTCFRLTRQTNLPIMKFFKRSRRIHVHHVPAAQQEEKKKDAWIFNPHEIERGSSRFVSTPVERKKKVNRVGVTMNRRHRLNRKVQFTGVYRYGVTVDAETFRILCRENRRSCSRFAAVVGRRFGPAVRRNKAKRIARILFDQFQKRISPSCDIILFPRIALLTQRRDLLTVDFENALRQARVCQEPV